MKKTIVTILFSMIFICLSSTVTGKAAYKATIDRKNDTMTMPIGKTYTLVFENEKHPEKIKLKSSDSSIVSIDKKTGKITAHKKGECVITTKGASKQYKIKTTVANIKWWNAVLASRSLYDWMIENNSNKHNSWLEAWYFKYNGSNSKTKLAIHNDASVTTFEMCPDGKCTTTIQVQSSSIDHYVQVVYRQKYGNSTIVGSQEFELGELSKDSEIDLVWDYLGGYTTSELNAKVKKNIATLVERFNNYISKTDADVTLSDFGIGEF